MSEKNRSQIFARLVDLTPPKGRVGKSWPIWFGFDARVYTRARAERWLEFSGFSYISPPSMHPDDWLRFDCIDRSHPTDSLTYSLFRWPEAIGVWCGRARVIG
jgi:hypothetical protein